MSIQSAIPETTADIIKITGISGDIHKAFALTEPKIKPAYPCRKQATGIPTAARILIAFLSVVIACLGLLGLTAYSSERRIKELGIRKINGAKVKNLIVLLSNQTLQSILIATIIAFPLVYLLNKMILENFAERIKMGVMDFIGSLIVVLVSTMIIIGWQIWSVARSNPVEALQYE